MYSLKKHLANEELKKVDFKWQTKVLNLVPKLKQNGGFSRSDLWTFLRRFCWAEVGIAKSGFGLVKPEVASQPVIIIHFRWLESTSTNQVS